MEDRDEFGVLSKSVVNPSLQQITNQPGFPSPGLGLEMRTSNQPDMALKEVVESPKDGAFSVPSLVPSNTMGSQLTPSIVHRVLPCSGNGIVGDNVSVESTDVQSRVVEAIVGEIVEGFAKVSEESLDSPLVHSNSI